MKFLSLTVIVVVAIFVIVLGGAAYGYKLNVQTTTILTNSGNEETHSVSSENSDEDTAHESAVEAEDTVFDNRSETENIAVDSDADEAVSDISIVVTDTEYALAVYDTEELFTWADNVFIGKVLEKSGEKLRQTVPGTQFHVQVISNIKGDTDKQVEVNQLGVGYKNGTLYVTEGDVGRYSTHEAIEPSDIFLKPGVTYLFITKYTKEEDWYSISAAPYDRELITIDSQVSDARLIELAKENARVKEVVKTARDLGVLSEDW